MIQFLDSVLKLKNGLHILRVILSGTVGLLFEISKGLPLFIMDLLALYYALLFIGNDLSNTISYLSRPVYQFYGMLFLLFEISTLFLNIHWFCDKVVFCCIMFNSFRLDFRDR